MLSRKERIFRVFLSAFLALLMNGCEKPTQESEQALGHFEQSSLAQTQGKKINDEKAKQVFDHVVESLRYSRYWHEVPEIGNDYVEGKQISALIFWMKEGRQPKVGFCSPDLARCLATSGDYIGREVEQMPIERNYTAKAAFELFVENGIDANKIRIAPQIIQPSLARISPTGSPNPSVPTISSTSAGQPFPMPKRLGLSDFEFAEKTITLPPLGLPTSISSRVVPKEAASEAKRVKQSYTCGDEGERPRGCTGTLVFAYYNESDSTWPVLRTCSSACPSIFQGDSIQFLRRGMDGWEASGSGHINSPKDEVARLKQKIEQAEMFRLQVP